MKKILILLLVCICLSPMVFGEKVTEIDIAFRAAALFMGKDCLYLVNRDTNVIHVYSKKDYSKLFTFGKKGEGPGEFKFVGAVFPSSKKICVTSMGKISFFSRQGKLMSEQKTSERSLFHRVGYSFVSQKRKLEPNRSSRTVQFVLVNKNLKLVKTLLVYKGSGNIYITGMKKQSYKMASSRPNFKTSQGKIIVGDPREDCCFTIYSEAGEKIKEFTYPYKKEKITAEIKDKMMKDFRKRIGSRWEQFNKMFNITYPDYFPPFWSFMASDGKILVFLYQKENGKQRFLAFDLEGNLLKRGLLKAGYAGAFDNKYYYYLKENEETELWELHREKLL